MSRIIVSYMGSQHRIDMLNVESSNVAAIGYDAEFLLLAVKFKNGSYYFYIDVRTEAWEGLRTAESKGGYLHRFIKPHFKFARLEVQEEEASEITADDLPQDPSFDESVSLAELNELLTSLGKTRLMLLGVREEFDQAKQEFMQSPSISALVKREQELAAKVSDYDSAVRQLALAIFGQTARKQISEHVSVIEARVLEYDEGQAFEHCRNHVHTLLSLNKTAFERYARSVLETAPLSFVIVSKVAKVAIATDLSALVLPQSAPAAPDEADYKATEVAE